MRVDSHQHFWKFDPIRDAWITAEMQTIRKDFDPVDLQPLLKKNNVDACVTIQVGQSEKETFFQLEHAAQNGFIKGVVGWVDLKSPKIKDRLTHFLQHKKVKGFRHIVQAEPDGFLAQKEFLRGIASLAEFGFTYDLLIYPHQLEEAISFVQQFPDQKIVLDHLAKPLIKNGILEPWATYIAELASFENVHCKISGMVTEADWQLWKAGDLIPYLDVVLECFGPQRLLYGSDWPVCLLASSYSRQLAVVEDFISRLSPGEKQGIMGENAIQFYNL